MQKPNTIPPMTAAQRFAECFSKATAIVQSYRAQAPKGFDPQNAETQVADLAIIPETFMGYSVEVTKQKSELITSGIIETDAQFSARADIGFDAALTATTAHGGQYTTLPYWNDLTGSDEVLSDTDSLTTAKMTSSNELAVIHNRAKAWSHNDLAAILAASDPATALGERLGVYWSRKLQEMTLSMLRGVFGSTGMSGNRSDIYGSGTLTAANYLSAESFIAAKQLLGDAKDDLTAVIMHSATEAMLMLNDLIDFIPDSEGKATIKTFQGMKVILDDTMTVEVINTFPVYSTFIFGRGAIAYGVGSADAPIYGAAPGSTWGAERSRESLAGQNIFINRRRMILHPRGFKWNGPIPGPMAGISPTNAEMADITSWTRVFEQKAIRMVRIRHNIDLTP